jgi:hypothetical protein
MVYMYVKIYNFSFKMFSTKTFLYLVHHYYYYYSDFKFNIIIQRKLNVYVFIYVCMYTVGYGCV